MLSFILPLVAIAGPSLMHGYKKQVVTDASRVHANALRESGTAFHFKAQVDGEVITALNEDDCNDRVAMARNVGDATWVLGHHLPYVKSCLVLKVDENGDFGHKDRVIYQ